jgi:myo-inositol-1(or 4)-monophosphatase
MMSYQKELTFAVKLAEEAGRIMKQSFALGVSKEWKSDNTPLTEADLKINRLVIDAVKQEFPDHGVLGEEESSESTSDYVWVCDPIDGTIPFSHGIPVFVFSLALVYKGESVAGVLFDPFLDRLTVAERGKGATLSGKPIKVSDSKKISQTVVNLEGTNNEFCDANRLRAPLLQQGSKVTTIGSVAYSGMLVALGEMSAVVFNWPHPWDGAAVKVIVEEAGGKVTDLFGNEQRWDRPTKGFVASNGLVHEQVLDLIKESKSRENSRN